ncbi:MAG: cation:proton antiporter [Bacteroidales bacterium]|nr:cation:proton antiporter [Bacteroidales bacterium]
MGSFLLIKLPFTDAVGIFTTLFFIILFLPPVFKKLKIPGIVGLILAGILVGPFGLNLLSKEIGFDILGSFGLLYLMFLVGLEINFDDFLMHKKQALLFGIFSFFIPFILGIVFLMLFYNLDKLAIIGIATMLGTHTLVSYPIVAKYGLKNHISVTLVIGATIIADTLALVSVSLFGDLSADNFSLSFISAIVLRYFVLFFFTLFLLPRICKWFFVNYEGDTTFGFIFTLAMAMASAFLSEILKIEPIIGTFFAGLTINRFIGSSPLLLSRISFFGETLFIPLFLIGVGILINPLAFTSSLSVWGLVGTLFIAYVAGKYIAAAIIQKQMKLNRDFRNLIAGLSSSKAAAAIAIAILLFKSGLMDETIINITVLLIMFTSFYSSFLTEITAKKILAAVISFGNPDRSFNKRLLVSVSNPMTMKSLIKFAAHIKESANTAPLHILSVSSDSMEAAKSRLVQEHIVREVDLFPKENDTKIELFSRIDQNVSNGIANAANDISASAIIIGWNIKKSAFQYFFGTLIRNLLVKTGKMVLVVKLARDISDNKRIYTIAPPKFEYENSFEKTIFALMELKNKTGALLTLLHHVGSENALLKEKTAFGNDNNLTLKSYSYYSKLTSFKPELTSDDLLIVIHARKNSLSYHRLMDTYPHDICELYPNNNCILMYPEQEPDEALSTL